MVPLRDKYKWRHTSSGEEVEGHSPPGSEPRGARALGEALVHNQVLTYLDISENELRDEGISFITRQLHSNVSYGDNCHVRSFPLLPLSCTRSASFAL